MTKPQAPHAISSTPCARVSPRRPPVGRPCAHSARPRGSWPDCPTARTTRVPAGPVPRPWPGCVPPTSWACRHPNLVRRQWIRGADVATPLTPVLSRFWDEPQPWSLDTYRRHDGYVALQRALAMTPDEVIATVKDSGL